MESISRIWRIPLEFRVNGLEFQRGYLERSKENPVRMDVLIEHRLLGRLRLHEEFVLELRHGTSREWHKATLVELRGALLQATKSQSMEPTGEDGLAGWVSSPRAELPSRRFPFFARIPVERDDSHWARVQDAFSLAREPFRIVGGLDSFGRCTGHITMAVQSVVEAQKLLAQAGFLQGRESKYEFVDSCTGWKIRLLPDRR